MTAANAGVRERCELLEDLRRQLPRLSERGRERTERAIRRLEVELVGGRSVAGKAATGDLGEDAR